MIFIEGGCSKILKVSLKFKKQKHLKSFTSGWKLFLTKVPSREVSGVE
jgi:hypothetical protein